MKHTTFIPDVDDMILLFIRVLDSLEFWDIEFGQFLIECQVLIKLHNCSENGISTLELSVGEFSLYILALTVENFINPAFTLEFCAVWIELLLESGLLSEFLAESFVEVDDDVWEALFLLGWHFLALHVLKLYCG